ncbi:hypothetical protein Tco_1079203 [Tanacetum coccineum]|uniref:Uncharacterized protein n=1 Tax=Tanacetum coccineum TaxID=301880 RepID=A0ABQ5HRH5_9ASTR
MGPERQPDAAAGAPDDAEDASIVDEGGQANPVPVQAHQQPPPPPPAAARTIPQRHSTVLSEGAHPQHSKDGPDRGLARPAPPQLSKISSSQTHDPSYPYLLSIGPREGNIDEYWWIIYKSGNLEVLES